MLQPQTPTKGVAELCVQIWESWTLKEKASLMMILPSANAAGMVHNFVRYLVQSKEVYIEGTRGSPTTESFVRPSCVKVPGMT